VPTLPAAAEAAPAAGEVNSDLHLRLLPLKILSFPRSFVA